MTAVDPVPTAPRASARARAALGHAARLFAGAVATVLAASFVIYAALSLTPGDPVDRVVGARASAEQRQAARVALGLDRPLPLRYADWLEAAVRGDLGRSITYREEVSRLIAPRLGTTLTLVALSAALILVFGVALGTLAGLSDRCRPYVGVLVSLGLAVPAFVSSSVLIGVFAVQLRWFPTFGAGDGLVGRLRHLLLPSVALALGWAAYVAQMTATAVREQATREHVSTAIGRGLSRPLLVRRHVLRNASLPVLTASGLTVAGLVAGSVVAESAFGVDGIGSLLLRSVLDKDYPVVLAIALLIVVIFVAVNMLVDLAQGLLDPQLSGGGPR